MEKLYLAQPPRYIWFKSYCYIAELKTRNRSRKAPLFYPFFGRKELKMLILKYLNDMESYQVSYSSISPNIEQITGDFPANCPGKENRITGIIPDLPRFTGKSREVYSFPVTAAYTLPRLIRSP